LAWLNLISIFNDVTCSQAAEMLEMKHTSIDAVDEEQIPHVEILVHFRSVATCDGLKATSHMFEHQEKINSPSNVN
jgi:hypothetical protein